MKAGPDGVVREQWLDKDSAMLRQPPEPIRAARSIETVDAPAASAAPSADADWLFNQRFEQWEARVAEAVDDDVENGGDGELSAAELAPWIGASILEMVDRAVAGVVVQMRTEMGSLRRSLEASAEQRRADRRRHVEERGAMRVRIADLEGKLADREKAHAAEAESWRDELRLLSDQLAELRSIDRLRHSRAGRSHDAAVALRLARKELEREAQGAA
jgi:hypothetical protein